MRVLSILAVAAALLSSACQTDKRDAPILAKATIAADFSTYPLRRVGVMPFQGASVGTDQSADLQSALGAEMQAAAPYEIVLLGARDLDEVRAADAHRLGWYPPETIIALSRRYRLDALVFGTVVRQQQFPPQQLDVQVDLVAAETGVPVWSALVQLDAADPRVQEGLAAFYGTRGDDSGRPGWRIALIAPNRFARFAAWQVASLL
ncbi:MAG: hypothetical protein EPO68_09225 [Planctomycetota bacterium]|nr:MAG: hypothetical protein EPO68_09225 [Planctomycetota bacterium]